MVKKMPCLYYQLLLVEFVRALRKKLVNLNLEAKHGQSPIQYA